MTFDRDTGEFRLDECYRRYEAKGKAND